MNRINPNNTNCSGCTACSKACPTKAITMISDNMGFYVPNIDDDKCVNCGKCIKVCQYHTYIQWDKGSKAYGFINCDKKQLKDSSSGSFFAYLAEEYIMNGGYVCGCIMDDNQNVFHIVSNKKEDIIKMQDSKYVQSDMKECYIQVIDLLRSGNSVLFTGTSCQVAGLKLLLRQFRVSDENLVSVDFFCHGVPSPMIWKDYINFYCQEKKCRIIKYRFRSKTYGWGKSSRGTYHLNTVWRNRGLIKKDNITLAARLWYFILFSNLCLRPYCYNCPYASLQKPADITMADFWGIEDLHPEIDTRNGCSLIISRTAKGEKILSHIDKDYVVDTDIKRAIKRQGNAFSSSPDNKISKNFWEDYKKYGFRYIAKKYFRYDMIHRTKDILTRLLFKMHLRNLYR